MRTTAALVIASLTALSASAGAAPKTAHPNHPRQASPPAQVNGHPTAAPKPKAPPVPAKGGPTLAQRKALEAPLKSLRRLEAATTVGVSEHDYQSRLIDTVADVNEALRAIPDDPRRMDNSARSRIVLALKAFQSAGTFWTESTEKQSRAAILDGASGPILKLYGLQLDRVGPLPPVPADLPDNPTEEQLAEQRQKVNDALAGASEALKISDADRTRILSAIWKAASDDIQQAESFAK